MSFSCFFFFFFNDTATTEIYTLSLHDALPICDVGRHQHGKTPILEVVEDAQPLFLRSEEHTSELQSPCNLVCRLLLEKKKKREQKASQKSTIYSIFTILTQYWKTSKYICQ